jgi:hypothetical protein
MIEFLGSQTPGRGTEEMKTTDVKGTFPPGIVGIGIELGRPGIGAFFRDVEKVAMALAPLGYHFAEENPVTHFMADKQTGRLREDVLREKATSAIIEGVAPLESLEEVLVALRKVSNEVNTVFTVEVITKVTPGGEVPIKDVLDRMGIWYSLNSKNNLGLGEPYFDFYGTNAKN